jgi:YHS domain-containing protein
MNKVLTAVAILSLVCLPGLVRAAEVAAVDSAVATGTEIAVSTPVEVGNKICPVSGEKVGTMGDAHKMEYKGKVYNLCCPMCVEEFNKDPEKYVKIAEEEVAATQPKQ